jgi:DNA-binding GntR family transcriptional regulator
MGELVRQTLADQAYEALHLRILNGELAAGERLLPDELATTMLISPTPIREALVRLQTEGLVASHSRRGSVVRRFEAAEIIELFEARLLVEAHAVARAAQARRFTPAVLEEMDALHHRLLAVLARRTRESLREALRLDRMLHAAIVALADNRMLAEWHRRVMAQTHTMRVYTLDSYAQDRLRSEHGAILEALRRDDVAGAQAALHTHLSRSRDGLLAHRTLPVPA